MDPTPCHTLHLQAHPHTKSFRQNHSSNAAHLWVCCSTSGWGVHCNNTSQSMSAPPQCERQKLALLTSGTVMQSWKPCVGRTIWAVSLWHPSLCTAVDAIDVIVFHSSTDTRVPDVSSTAAGDQVALEAIGNTSASAAPGAAGRPGASQDTSQVRC
jgi:hypothetical protein